MGTYSPVAKEEQHVGDRLEGRLFTAGIAGGAIALLTLAVTIVLTDRNAPSSFLEGLPGAAFFALLIAAVALAGTKRLIERGRGTKLLQSSGHVWRLAFALVFFQLAWLVSLLALGLAAGLLLAAGWSQAGLLLRACAVLLVGGAFLTIVGGVVRDMLLLSLPRGR